MKNIKGNTALVTGGTSGIGWEFSQQLAAKGCNVLMVSIQKDLLDTLPAQLSAQYGVQSWGLYLDLVRDDAADELWNWCRQNNIEIDILVNNAGIFFVRELGPDSRDRAETMIKLHVMTPFRLVALFGQDMKQRHKGYIVNMSSLAAKMPIPGITNYSATKAFLMSFSKSMYYEMRLYGVGVTAVLPAAIATTLYRLQSRQMKFGVALGLIRTPQWLVRRSLRAMLHHRQVLRPTMMNFFLPLIIKMMPKLFITKLWKKYKDDPHFKF